MTVVMTIYMVLAVKVIRNLISASISTVLRNIKDITITTNRMMFWTAVLAGPFSLSKQSILDSRYRSSSAKHRIPRYIKFVISFTLYDSFYQIPMFCQRISSFRGHYQQNISSGMPQRPLKKMTFFLNRFIVYFLRILFLVSLSLKTIMPLLDSFSNYC